MELPNIPLLPADVLAVHRKGKGLLGWAERQLIFHQGRLWPNLAHPWTARIVHVAQMAFCKVVSEVTFGGAKVPWVSDWFEDVEEARGEWVVVIRPNLASTEQDRIALRLLHCRIKQYAFLDLAALWKVGSAASWWRRCAWWWVSRRFRSTPETEHCVEHLVRHMTNIVPWPRGWDQYPHDWVAKPDLVGCAPLADWLLSSGKGRLIWASPKAPLEAHDLVVVG